MTAAVAGLECRALTKSYGGVHAVDDVSAAFQPGQIAALIGPNGAGKTTLFHLFAGMVRPDRGEVLLKGRIVTGLPPWRIAASGLGRLFQDVRVFAGSSVLDNIRVAIPGQAGEDPFTAFWQLRRVIAQDGPARARALELLGLVGLQAHADRMASDLSFGQQKLLALARLLASGADVLLLDEPTAGIAPGIRESIITTLRDLARGGRTVVLIEHDLAAVRALADVVYVMRDGRIQAVGPIDVVMRDAALGRGWYFDVGAQGM